MRMNHNCNQTFFYYIVDGGSSVGSGPLMSPGLWKTPTSSAGGQSTVMAELTNLVNAHPRAGMQAGMCSKKYFSGYM